jgi:catechol 2,3-dioxygenase-like lactoylglutathione lyase family enzyme
MGAQAAGGIDKGDPMAGKIDLGEIHHIRLTVTDYERSRAFYTGLLGFDVAAEAPKSDDPKSDPSYPVLWGGCVMAKGSDQSRARAMRSMRTGSGSTT